MPYDSSRPSIPAGVRRTIELEAGHCCSVVGCGEHTYLEIHHINGNREDNQPGNLILLCDKHHKMAHAGVISRKDLHGYKGILRDRMNGGVFVRGQERDRVHQFLKLVCETLSYEDEDGVSYVGSTTGYWFEQDVYLKLKRFFSEEHRYRLELRSHDEFARELQDRIVDLMRQLHAIRESGNYRYDGGYCAFFVPINAPGAPGRDSEINAQIGLVNAILLEIQELARELWAYVEAR